VAGPLGKHAFASGWVLIGEGRGDKASGGAGTEIQINKRSTKAAVL
jgi:hypothetical protein